MDNIENIENINEINVFFYKLQSNCRSSYKKNLINQLNQCVSISKIFKIVYELNKASIVFTINDHINDPELNDKKIIVYSFQDNAITNNNIINKQNVILVLDHCRLLNIKNRLDVINGHRNFYLLAENYSNNKSKLHFQFQHMFYKNDNYNKKVKCLLNISKIYKRQFQANIIPLHKRVYDVVFVGHIDYPGADSVTKLRKDVINNIIQVCKKNNWTYYVNMGKLPINKYYKLLANTKIFVSPYGYGEFSTKEYECICYGAHILKSKIYFEYYPNFCKNMDDFELNFCNFESKIYSILNNLNIAQNKVNENRKLFLSYNYRTQSQLLEDAVLKAL